MARFHHVQLAIPEGAEPRARDFWVSLLGADEVDKPESLQGRGGLWLKLGDADVHLGIDPDFQPARKAHPAFEVPELNGISDNLTAAGHSVEFDVPIGTAQRFHTFDPFGNRIEFIES